MGLHGLMFIIPVPSPDPIAPKPEEKTVNLATLPKPTPQATSTPKLQPSPKPSPKPSVTPAAIAKPSPAIPAQSTPTQSPSPTPSTTPSPTTTPSPSPSPKDVLQLDGATPGCNGREGCWQIQETKGRMVAGTLEQQLQNQGYQVTEKELNEDTGIRVYQVEKAGTPSYYLHLIWSDRGTAYVRNSQILSRSELEAITQL